MTPSPSPGRKAASMAIPFADPGFPFFIQTRRGRRVAGAYHRHRSVFEVHFFRRGTGFYLIRNALYRIAPRTVFLIPGGHAHGYVLPESETPGVVEEVALMFGRDLAAGAPSGRALLRPGGGASHILVLDDRTAASAEMLLTLMQWEWDERRPDREACIRHALAHFLILLRRVREGPGGTGERPPAASLLARRLATYVDRRFGEPIALADLAAFAGRTTSHVSRVFREGTGMTFKEYLITRRVMEAKRLLDKGDARKLYALALAVGFTSLRSFQRAFRRVTGVSPAHYRRHMAVSSSPQAPA